MAIKKIKVSNFKTFKNLDLELGSFNVVIGANASGKSNFVEIFQFLKDVRKDGLKNAVAMHRTMSSILNLKCTDKDMLRICVEKDGECNNSVVSSSSFDVSVMSSEYDISIQSDMKISEEKLSYQFIDSNKQKYNVIVYRDVKDEGKLKYDVKPPTKEREKALLRSVSQMFTPDKEWKLEPDDIYILSAKYGLLELNQEIEPYDLTLNNMSSGQIKFWAIDVLKELKKRANLDHDHFIFLAGQKYRKYLIQHIGSVEIPLQGLTIGKQLQLLKRKLDE